MITLGLMVVCNGKIVGLGLKILYWLMIWPDEGFDKRDVDGNSTLLKETCLDI